MRLVLPLLAAATTAFASMDMNMDDTSMADMSQQQSPNSSELDPVPHRKMHHGKPILETNLYPEERAFWEAYNTTTFFTLEDSNKHALITHVLSTYTLTVITYPITLILNNVKSNWYIPVLTLNLIVAFLSLFSLAIFGSSLSDNMYPKNSYVRMAYILFFAMLIHYVSAFFTYAANWLSKENSYSSLSDDYSDDSCDSANGNSSQNSIKMKNIFSHQRGSSTLSPSSTLYDFDHANYTVHSTSNTPSLDAVTEESNNDINDFEIRDSSETADHQSANYSDEENLLDSSLRNYKTQKIASRFSKIRDSYLGKIIHNSSVQLVISKFGTLSSVVFNTLNYPLFFYLMIYSVTGIAVGNMLGQGNKVFNLLAHFIKGGVFFILGLISLARYNGCWSTHGYSWNAVYFTKEDKNKSGYWFIKFAPMKGLITMEFIESFLIFFYGSTNIFLEHLANPGGEWAAKDLQHASIAFMYIGGGLCGLLTEFGLSDWRFKKATQSLSVQIRNSIEYAHPGYSPNPFPAFTIFWTGILMSQHAQASPVSTTIHTQWGYMFSYGAIVRLFSYVMCLLSKSVSVSNTINILAVKPFTELLTTSALIAGGLIFMESTDQIVNALEYRGLTPMFTLNVSVGLAALIMSWEMILLFWRNWLLKRSSR